MPFLAQTEALCGGAAVAMVFRYWGDRRADVRDFAPLVDREAGGISQRALVEAVRARGWTTTPLAGSFDVLRERLGERQPVILLIEDRPGRYHYVVAVAAGDDRVVVHDPARGPARTLTSAQLDRAWQPTNYWALLVLPSPRVTSTAEQQSPAAPTLKPAAEESSCDLLLNAALDNIERDGLSAADDALGRVRDRCPDDPRPVAELAGVRFAARDWGAAAALAEEATDRDRTIAYAWDVLGSSRYVQGDVAGALRAWNQIDRPRIDLVQIGGLSRTDHALVWRALRLEPNDVLSEAAYRRAERRLAALPTRVGSRIGVVPGDEGYALVDVAMAERGVRPGTTAEWGAAAARTAVAREVEVALPGRSGQGELWTASWRWWEGRPRVAISFAAPRVGFLPGVWRVDGAWERERYGHGDTGEPQPTVIEERVHAGLSFSDWITPDLRYTVGASLDSWDSISRMPSFGIGIERRLLADAVVLGGSARFWLGSGGAASFQVVDLFSRFQWPLGPLRVAADAGVQRASPHARRSVLPGVGAGDGRTVLLRAHPLERDGIVRLENLSRRVIHGSTEVQRWFLTPWLAEVGMAAFADAADLNARRHVDVGVGLRMRAPTLRGTLRLDYARGLHDGAAALSVSVGREF